MKTEERVMRIYYKRSVVVGSLVAALAGMGSAPLAQGPDSLDISAVLSATLGEVRGDFPIGRVYLDRVIVDTTRRMAPPLVNRREHKLPQDWAAPNGVMTVDTDVATPMCNPGYIQCRLPSGVVAVIAMSEPVIHGDSARVVVRHSEPTGIVATRITTTVETVTLKKVNGEWKVTRRKVSATA
jgi:hypothetical protein